MDSGYYNEKYSVEFVKSKTAQFQFYLLREGAEYLCIIQIKVLKMKFKEEYKQLQLLKAETQKMAQENKQQKTREESFLEAARTSREAISNNSDALISIGSQQHKERPKTPDIESPVSDVNVLDDDIYFDVESEELFTVI